MKKLTAFFLSLIYILSAGFSAFASFTPSDPDAELYRPVEPAPEMTVAARVTMKKGEKKDLSALIRTRSVIVDEPGYELDSGAIYGPWYLVGTVEWASSMPDTVYVNEKGVATAIKNGSASITAAALDNLGNEHIQTVVVGVSDSGAYISPAQSFEINEGSWLDLSLLAGLRAGDGVIKWQSSMEDTATVDENGMVFAKNPGRLYITAEYTGANGAAVKTKYRLRSVTGSLSHKTKSSVISLRAGEKINLGRLFYSNYLSMPQALGDFYLKAAGEAVSFSGMTVTAKQAGTATVHIFEEGGRNKDDRDLHKVTIAVR